MKVSYHGAGGGGGVLVYGVWCMVWCDVIGTYVCACVRMGFSIVDCGKLGF